MIYENDIPDMPDNTIHADEIVAKHLYITPQGINPRWKPNGITNNIEQYESKAGLKGETRLKKRMWKHALRKAVYNYCKKQRYSAN